MALVVNIPGMASATLDESDYIHVSLLVEIKDGAVVYDSKTIIIVVFRYTSQVLSKAVTMMVDEINRYKALCMKQQTIQSALSTFTSSVIAQV